MRIQLAPKEAGKPFTSTAWTGEVDWDSSVPWKFRDLTSEGDTRQEALALLKRRARDLGYRANFPATLIRGATSKG